MNYYTIISAGVNKKQRPFKASVGCGCGLWFKILCFSGFGDERLEGLASAMIAKGPEAYEYIDLIDLCVIIKPYS